MPAPCALCNPNLARSLAVLAALAAGAPAAATAGTITADGAAEVSVPADGASVHLEVEGRGDTAAAASAAAAAKLDRLLAALAPLGEAIAGPHSTGYNVAPDWQWDEEGRNRHLAGYRATSGLRVEVRDLARLGPLLDAALAGGADGASTPELTATGERAARDRALELAFGQARRDAEVLARAAGGRLGALVELSTNPETFRGGSAKEITVTATAPGVQMPAPEVTVRVTVAARWEVGEAAP